MARSSIAIFLVLLCVARDAAAAGQTDDVLRRKQAQLRWSELAPVLVDRRVAIALPDGARIQGDVLAVRDEALVLDIAKTSKSKLHPKGQAAVPRQGITEIRVIRNQGPGKLAGGLAGAVGGVFTAGAMAYYLESAGALVGLFLVLPVMAVAGYYAGKAADRRSTVIHILSQPAAAPEERR